MSNGDDQFITDQMKGLQLQGDQDSFDGNLSDDIDETCKPFPPSFIQQSEKTSNENVLQPNNYFINESPLYGDQEIMNFNNQFNSKDQKDFYTIDSRSTKENLKENFPGQSSTQKNKSSTKKNHGKNFKQQVNELAREVISNKGADLSQSQKAQELLFSQHQLNQYENQRNDKKNNQENLFNRLNQEADEIRERHKQMSENYHSSKMKECSFAPRVNTFNSESDERRTFNQFLSDQTKFQKLRDEKSKMLKYQLEENNADEFTHQPKINKNIGHLSERDNRVTVHDRLFSLSKKENTLDKSELIKYNVKELQRESTKISYNKKDSRMPTSCNTERQDKDENDSFRPQINEKSKNIVRSKKIGDHLYQDAQKRKEKVIKVEQQQQNKNKEKYKRLTSLKSEYIVAQKFIKEYENVLSEVYQNCQFNMIDYIKLGEILRRMTFLHSDRDFDNQHAPERSLLYDIWFILKGDSYGGISKRNLCQFLLVLLGINNFPLGVDVENAKDVCSYPAATALAKDDDDNIETSNSPNKSPPNYQSRRAQKMNQDDQEDSAHKQVKYNTQFDSKLREVMKGNGLTGNTYGHFDTNGNWLIEKPDEQKELQKTFDLLYRNRLSGEALKKSNFKHDNSFHPQINDTSKNLANQYRERLLEETAQLIENKEIQVKVPENGKITHVDLLVYQKQAQNKDRERNQQDKIQQELSKCSFKPSTNLYETKSKKSNMSELEQSKISNTSGFKKSLELYSQAKPRNQKRDRNTNDVEYEKNCDECTFQPDLISVKAKRAPNSLNVSQSKQPGAKNVDKVIERMKEGRKRRDNENLMFQRGYHEIPTNGEKSEKKQINTTNYSLTEAKNNTLSEMDMKQMNEQQYDMQNSNIQQFQSDEKNNQKYFEEEQNDTINSESNIMQNTQQQNSQLEDNKSAEKVPLLFVDVNLGPGRTERIVVFEGDTSQDLATQFAETHGLESAMSYKLKELLDSQISGLLTRIDEEIPSANSDCE